ncbi:MAG: GAK system ATP-grasp enzyme [Phycisphaerales bacterium]|nr:GAK system ATP-grasp enzyme [Phycisphaerales bacterium]
MRHSEKSIGVVGVPGAWSTQRLFEAVAGRVDQAVLIDLGAVRLDLTTGEALSPTGDGALIDLTTLDAIMVKKLGLRYTPHLLDRLEVLRYVEQRGVRVFSRPDSIGRLLDRMACTVALRAGDVPMPDTILTEDITAAAEIVREFKTAVLKPLYTTKARGMRVVRAEEDVTAVLEDYRAAGNQVFYIQRKVALPGRDLGVSFVGGEYLASYARVGGGGSWNTTIRAGGKYEPADPPSDIIDLAHRAQALFDLDFTCVDIAETEHGPLVFEVSAFGGFRGLREAHGIDAADAFTNHVLRQLA